MKYFNQIKIGNELDALASLIINIMDKNREGMEPSGTPHFIPYVFMNFLIETDIFLPISHIIFKSF